MTSRITLTAGQFKCDVEPDMGACIAGLWMGGVPVLRSAAVGQIKTARESGSYPLVKNFGNEPHAIHCVGWQRPWQVLDESDNVVMLSYEHKPDAAWPFAFDTSQAFRLTANELELTLSITN